MGFIDKTVSVQWWGKTLCIDWAENVSESGGTVDSSLRKFCCKGLIKNGEGAGEHMRESKGGLLLFLRWEIQPDYSNYGLYLTRSEAIHMHLHV